MIGATEPHRLPRRMPPSSARRQTGREQGGDLIRQAPRTAPESKAAAGLTHLLRPTRALLTRKGRPPLRLAGLETSERRQQVAQDSLDLLATR